MKIKIIFISSVLLLSVTIFSGVAKAQPRLVDDVAAKLQTSWTAGPQRAAGKSVSTSQFQGATLGARLAAAESELRGQTGEIIVEVNGVESINQQIVISDGRTLRVVGKGTITSNLSGVGTPWLKPGSNFSLLCDNWGVVLQAPSGKANYHIIRPNVTSNVLTVSNWRIEGCHFQGSSVDDGGDGSVSSLVDVGNLHQGLINHNWFENARAGGLQIGGASSPAFTRTVTAIDATTNTITTSAPHGLAVEDRVQLSGIVNAGNGTVANLNGFWMVYAVPSATTFKILGPQVTGSMSGTARAGLINQARQVWVTDNLFTGSRNVDVAVVNAQWFHVDRNIFKGRNCGSSPYIDLEPNVASDSLEHFTVNENEIDNRFNNCTESTAIYGIDAGGGGGVPTAGQISHNLIQSETMVTGSQNDSSAGGVATGTVSGLKGAIAIWNGRDVTISDNTIVGSVVFVTGERMKVTNNKFSLFPGNRGPIISGSSPEGVAPGVGLVYSEITNNSYSSQSVRYVNDLVTNNTRTVTSQSGGFSSVDVGKEIRLPRVTTTIASITNPTTAVLAATPGGVGTVAAKIYGDFKGGLAPGIAEDNNSGYNIYNGNIGFGSFSLQPTSKNFSYFTVPMAGAGMYQSPSQLTVPSGLYSGGLITTTGGLQHVSAGRPRCDANTRGTTWYVAGASGVADTYQVCLKDASDAYAWVNLR